MASRFSIQFPALLVMTITNGKRNFKRATALLAKGHDVVFLVIQNVRRVPLPLQCGNNFFDMFFMQYLVTRSNHHKHRMFFDTLDKSLSHDR
jgi:hypothetical protein